MSEDPQHLSIHTHAAIRESQAPLEPRLRLVIRLLMIGGAVIALIRIGLIPLPGPGYQLLIDGAIALLTGAVLRVTAKQGPRQTS